MHHEDAGDQLLGLINGFQASQAIHVAAELGLADLLGSRARSIGDLAKVSKTNPDSLYRLMRALASIGVMREEESQYFSLTEVGENLRSDSLATHAPWARLIGRPNYWQAWGDLLYGVRSGAVAFDHVHGSGVWEYRTKHPAEAAIFDRAMATRAQRSASSLLTSYDFSKFKCIVDVGGGDGSFLASILTAHPHVRGILFDQQHVLSRAKQVLAASGLAERSQIVAGSFFEKVPLGGDAYILKWILHDWDDVASIDILRTCRQIMRQTDQLIIIEYIVAGPNKAPAGKFMDLNMMVITGGRERTRDEFTALLASAGFRVMSVVPTTSSLSVVEAAPT